MLNILHEKINSIAEIISIEEITSNTFNIAYKDPNSITSQQQLEINNIVSSWPLDLLKINKLKELDKKWDSTINNGFLTQYGWSLGLSNNDVTLLTGAFLLGKEASSLNISQNTTIIDVNGISHSININDLTILMLEYGQYRTQLSTEYANKKNLIQQSQSTEELNNIVI